MKVNYDHPFVFIYFKEKMMKVDFDNPVVLVGSFVIILFLIFGSYGFIKHQTTQETITATVTGKERIVERDADGGVKSKYLIFTDSETFENTDSLWALKFNSSDLYGKLQEGQTCEFEVVGFRVGWMSMYRNILKAECE